mgnify:CR=1 FL=1
MIESTHHLLRAILDTINDPILLVANDERIVDANNAANHLFDLQGVTNPTVTDLPDPLRALIRERKPLPEWILDDEHAFVPRYTLLTPDDRAETFSMLTLCDISQLKKLTRNQNEFIRIAAHDLRSPLTSIQGFANMLELGLVGILNEKQQEFIAKILSGVTQLTALVENIQDAGRFDPETGFYEMERAPCDLRELVAHVVADHLVPAEKGALTLMASIASDIPIVSVDANMIERAVTNLVDNAIKYTPNGGVVTVDLSKRDNDIIIAVTDSGLGISPENQKKLFQRHVRIARQEYKRVKGSGLGLFIVRSVAQHHGGDASVESTEGVGSTFSIRLPLADAGIT